MSKPTSITKEIAGRFGIIWIDPWTRPTLPNQGLPGVCEWRPHVATADIGHTNLDIGQVHALPYEGVPQMSIKEYHPQDEIFVVFDSLVVGLSETMNETENDVTWVILLPGMYIIKAGVIHVPPVSLNKDNISPMLVIQGTKNTTAATKPVIAHPVVK